MVAALVLAGCGDDEGDGDGAGSTTTAATETTESSTTTEPPATTTTEARTPEEDVEAAYWEAEEVLHDLLQAPDPDDSRLAETRTDPSLSHVSGYLQELLDDGIAAQPAGGLVPVSEIRSVEVREHSATVESCYIDNLLVIDAATGEVQGDSVTTALVETTLTLNSESWKVSDSVTLFEWEDGTGCDR